MLILAIRSGTDQSVIERTFEGRKVNIPKAPGEGLLLRKVDVSTPVG